MALDNNQKRFIKNKVKELGSYEKVKNFYTSDSLVCQYALECAGKRYGVPKRKKLKL